MWDFLKNLKEFLSLNYRSLFIVTGLCWVIVFLPKQFLETVSLLDLWLQYRSLVTGLGIIFSTWLIIGGLYDLINFNKDKIITWFNSRQNRQKQEKLLLSTSRVEREVLYRYIANDTTTTIAFDFRDGVVNGLISKKILRSASQGSNPFSSDFDVNIESWAWDYLRNHKEIFDGIELKDSGRHQIRL